LIGNASRGLHTAFDRKEEKTMKRNLLLICSVISLLLIPLWTVSIGAPIELKMAHYASPESKEQEILKAGADWMEKRFPGRIKVTIYPAQTLLSAMASYEGTVKGIADITSIVPGWHQGRFPKTEAIDLPPGVPSAVDGTQVYWEFYKKFLTDEWKEVKVLSFHVQVPQSLHTKKKSIRTLQDIKGEKMRVYGIGKEVMTAFGGVPIAMPMSEAYEAIRQGVVSGIMVPCSEMKGFRLIDVCFHHTAADVFASPFFVIMNMEKYNSLPADIKKAFDEELAPFWNVEAAKIWDRWEGLGRELIKNTPGHELVILSPAEKNEWREKAKSINSSWASALEAKGLPGKKLLEEKLRAIAKYVK
jgi:TRAP-type C4-dicarboxylate transport system substrate-binding protein